MPDETLLARRQRSLGPAYRLFYDEPVDLVEGRGVWLRGADGKRYLDAYNNVPHVGHCHPDVIKALVDQASRLNIHTRYLNDRILEYSERLTETMPEPLRVTMFTCSGSEANDLALRIATACTGGEGTVVTSNAYHGNTGAVAQISMSYKAYEGRGDHVETVPAPDEQPEDVGSFAAAVTASFERLKARGHKPRALVMDSIFASDGIKTPDAESIRLAVAVCRKFGALYIADEVQPGFGRTGEHMWGFDHFGVTPDIVTLGKPMGNGHPIAATVLSDSLASEFGRSTRYFNTFGGNPVSCAVGLAVLDVIEREQLMDNARKTGAFLRHALQALADRHDVVRAIRGRGFFLGIELDPGAPFGGDLATLLVNDMKSRGVLIGQTGPEQNVLKVRPPMPFSAEHATLLLETLDESLTSASQLRETGL